MGQDPEPALPLFVLEADGRVVATAHLNVMPNLTRSGSPYAVIENVVVEETLRAQAWATSSWLTCSGQHVMQGAIRRC